METTDRYLTCLRCNREYDRLVPGATAQVCSDRCAQLYREGKGYEDQRRD